MKTSNHSVENLGSSLKITITTPRPWIQIWIFGAMLMFVAIFTTSLISSSSSSVLKVFVGIMMVWEIWGVYYFLKLLFGKETIEINKKEISVGSHLLWFAQTKKYPGELVQEVGVQSSPYSHEQQNLSRQDMWWDKGEGFISLTVDSQRVQLGRWLDVEEAQEIVTEIQRSFPQYATAKESA